MSIENIITRAILSVCCVQRCIMILKPPIVHVWIILIFSEKRKKSCLLNDKVIGSKGLAKCLLMFYEEEKKYNFFYGVAANLIYCKL